MKHLLLTLGLFSVLITDGQCQNNNVCLAQTSVSWFESKIVNDKYLIECYIPENVSKPIDSIPIIFVLDADMSFAMTYDIVRWLKWGNEIPDVAIVGISYGKTQADWWQKRSRDFTTCQDKTEIWGKWEFAGGGDRFIRFIENELFPYLEKKHKLSSPNRTIVGLSFGGLISTEILFSKTELFKNYIIAGPALQWNDRAIFKKEENYAETNKTLNAIVFTSIGNLDDKTITEPWKEFNNLISKRKYENLVYETEIIENETHLSMFPAALTKGIKFVLNQQKY
ncbi:MAG: alpha/beta hydrolase [Bacteroidales bacterium]|nr:alpha/beta hydrolase [Bacteroidales bacterium]